MGLGRQYISMPSAIAGYVWLVFFACFPILLIAKNRPRVATVVCYVWLASFACIATPAIVEHLPFLAAIAVAVVTSSITHWLIGAAIVTVVFGFVLASIANWLEERDSCRCRR